MHELSICQSLLREVERVAAMHGGRYATAVTVAVGPLSGIEPALLVRAFELARAGTLADHAALQIELMPVIVRCEACGIETATPANALLCGTCSSWHVEVKSGDELLLKRVELAGTSPPPSLPQEPKYGEGEADV